MAPIQSYVFFDLETTSLPKLESNKTKITELSIVVVKRRHLLNTTPGKLPRVQNKLVLCFNPEREFNPKASTKSDLNNDLLQFETIFDEQVFNTINMFLGRQEKPLCLIAHNGYNFEFPIVKNHFEALNAHLDADVMCADSLYAFYDIYETNKTFHGPIPSVVPKRWNEIKRNFFFHTPTNSSRKSDTSYKLKDIYERVVGLPLINPHRGENDCGMIAQIATYIPSEFVEWIDNNHCPFSEVTTIIR